MTYSFFFAPLGLHVFQFGLLSLPLGTHLLNVFLQLSVHISGLFQLLRQQVVHLVQTRRPETNEACMYIKYTDDPKYHGVVHDENAPDMSLK